MKKSILFFLCLISLGLFAGRKRQLSMFGGSVKNSVKEKAQEIKASQEQKLKIKKDDFNKFKDDLIQKIPEEKRDQIASFITKIDDTKVSVKKECESRVIKKYRKITMPENDDGREDFKYSFSQKQDLGFSETPNEEFLVFREETNLKKETYGSPSRFDNELRKSLETAYKKKLFLVEMQEKKGLEEEIYFNKEFKDLLWGQLLEWYQEEAGRLKNVISFLQKECVDFTDLEDKVGTDHYSDTLEFIRNRIIPIDDIKSDITLQQYLEKMGHGEEEAPWLAEQLEKERQNLEDDLIATSCISCLLQNSKFDVLINGFIEKLETSVKRLDKQLLIWHRESQKKFKKITLYVPEAAFCNTSQSNDEYLNVMRNIRNRIILADNMEQKIPQYL